MNVPDYRSAPRQLADEPASPLAIAVPVALALSPVLVVGWEVARRWPVNHWAIDVRWLAVIPAGAGAWALLTAAVGALTRRQLAAALAAAGCAVALIWLADALNLLVGYDTWVERGMPEPWHLGS